MSVNVFAPSSTSRTLFKAQRCILHFPPSVIFTNQDTISAQLITSHLTQEHTIPLTPQTTFTMIQAHPSVLELILPRDIASTSDAHLLLQINDDPIIQTESFSIQTPVGEPEQSSIERCICGRNHVNAPSTDWLQCSTCEGWSHLECYQTRSGARTRDSFSQACRTANPLRNSRFQCGFCRKFTNPSIVQQQIKARIKATRMYLAPTSARLKMDPSMDYTTDEGVVDFIKWVVAEHGAKATWKGLDACCGQGTLTRVLSPSSEGVDNDLRLIQRARLNPSLKQYTFHHGDFCDASYIFDRLGQFNVVVTNPPFDMLFEVVEAAFLLLGPSRANFVLLLAPNTFISTARRSALYEFMSFHIVVQYNLGCLSYLDEHGDKKTPDSLFVLRRGHGPNQTDKTMRPICEARRMFSPAAKKLKV